MRIINIILGKKGGNKRVFIDFLKFLLQSNCELHAILYDDDRLYSAIPDEVKLTRLKNFGQWDPVLPWKLKKIINSINPQLIIVHGARAAQLFTNIDLSIPIVAICSNEQIKNLPKFEYLIATSEALRSFLLKNHFPSESIYTAASTIYLEYKMEYRKPNFDKKTLTIGTIGKLKASNGFKPFLHSLSILRNRGLKFNATIAGTGVELENLKHLAKDLIVDDIVAFEGWIDDKDAYLRSIDIFCLPTMSGNSSITMLEAFMYSLPVVATKVIGHKNIANDQNAILVPTGEPDALALALEQLMNAPAMANKLSKAGFLTASTKFDNQIISKELYNILESIVKNHHIKQIQVSGS